MPFKFHSIISVWFKDYLGCNSLSFRSAGESSYLDISRQTPGEVKRRWFKNNVKEDTLLCLATRSSTKQ